MSTFASWNISRHWPNINRSVFLFVTKRLRFMSCVPGATIVFEGLLLLWNALIDRAMMRRLDTLERAVEALRDVTVSLHRFGGTQFNAAGRELGHVHGNGLVDMPVTAAVKADWLERCIVEPHHQLRESPWISLWIKSDEDLETAIRLFRESHERITQMTLKRNEQQPELWS